MKLLLRIVEVTLATLKITRVDLHMITGILSSIDCHFSSRIDESMIRHKRTLFRTISTESRGGSVRHEKTSCGVNQNCKSDINPTLQASASKEA